MTRTKSRFKSALRVALLAGAILLLVRVVARADFGQVLGLASAVGTSGLLLMLLPQLASRAAESYGWKLAVRPLGHDLGFAMLLRIRMATEALAQSLPAGVVISESVKPLLLGRHYGLEVSESVATIVVRKYLLVLSQSAYVAAMALFGFQALRGASPRVLGSAGLEWLAFGAALVLLLLAVGMSASLRQSRVARRVFDLLRRISRRRSTEWLAAYERRFSETDRCVSKFFEQHTLGHLRPAAWFFAGWLLEALETYLVVTLLGADVGFFEIAAIEVVIGFVRNVVFFVPAGIGVQDVGYVAFFAALGITDATTVGAAFVLLKRAKELFWVAVGYALLALESKPFSQRFGQRGAALGIKPA